MELAQLGPQSFLYFIHHGFVVLNPRQLRTYLVSFYHQPNVLTVKLTLLQLASKNKVVSCVLFILYFSFFKKKVIIENLFRVVLQEAAISDSILRLQLASESKPVHFVPIRQNKSVYSVDH